MSRPHRSAAAARTASYHCLVLRCRYRRAPAHEGGAGDIDGSGGMGVSSSSARRFRDFAASVEIVSRWRSPPFLLTPPAFEGGTGDNDGSGGMGVSSSSARRFRDFAASVKIGPRCRSPPFLLTLPAFSSTTGAFSSGGPVLHIAQIQTIKTTLRKDRRPAHAQET